MTRSRCVPSPRAMPMQRLLALWSSTAPLRRSALTVLIQPQLRSFLLKGLETDVAELEAGCTSGACSARACFANTNPSFSLDRDPSAGAVGARRGRRRCLAPRSVGFFAPAGICRVVVARASSEHTARRIIAVPRTPRRAERAA